MDRDVPLEGSRFFVHHDFLGSAVAVTNDVDPEDATIVERFTYSAYGEIQAWHNTTWNSATGYGTPSAVSKVRLPFLYTGQRYEPVTGLHYYKNRQYDPTTGRFLRRDLLGYSDGVNLYQYAGAAPNAWIDPLGLTYYDPQGGKGTCGYLCSTGGSSGGDPIGNPPDPARYNPARYRIRIWAIPGPDPTKMKQLGAVMDSLRSDMSLKMAGSVAADMQARQSADPSGFWKGLGVDTEQIRDSIAGNGGIPKSDGSVLGDMRVPGLWEGRYGPEPPRNHYAERRIAEFGYDVLSGLVEPLDWYNIYTDVRHNGVRPMHFLSALPFVPFTVVKRVAGATTNVTHGFSQAAKQGTPNSIFEQLDDAGQVRSRTFYDDNGHPFTRQDFDHSHGGIQPHETTRTFNAQGQPTTSEVTGPLPPGYDNTPTVP